MRRVPLVRDWVARVGSVFLYVGTSTSTPIVIDSLYAAFLDIVSGVSGRHGVLWLPVVRKTKLWRSGRHPFIGKVRWEAWKNLVEVSQGGIQVSHCRYV